MEDSAMRAMPWDIKVINLFSFLTSIMGSMLGPFIATRLNKDLTTAAATGSLSSLSGLVGALVLGRFSDRFSRKASLCVAQAGQLVVCACAIIFPAAQWPLVLNPFFGTGASGLIKSMFTDYCISMQATMAETSSWMGSQMLLMMVSVAIGPIVGPKLASSFEHILALYFVTMLVTSPLLLLLHKPVVEQQEQHWTFRDFMDLKVARTPAGIWYLVWSFLLVFIYHVLQTILMPSLLPRFGADVAMMGQLQTVTGLGGMLGTIISGPIARRLCKPHPTNLISSFMVVTCSMRIVMLSCSTFFVYNVAMFIFAVAGIGVISPVRSGLLVQFVDADEVGGFVGLKEAVESLSGILGPAAAGGIGAPGKDNVNILFWLVFSLYLFTPFYAFFGYPRFVQPQVERVAETRKGNKKE